MWGSGTLVRKLWRRALLGLGCVVMVCGLLHHVDHVVRGKHSGWPFVEEVTPFTFSLLVYGPLLPGIFVNLWGRWRPVGGCSRWRWRWSS